LPIARRQAPQITPQLIELYETALKLRALERRGRADHATVHEAEAAVERHLGGGIRRLWLTSVFDIYDDPPGPDDMVGRRTLEHRKQLDAAVQDLQRGRREARRAAKAAAPANTEPTGEPEPEQ
jgi:hypothetical protein